jgi:hypothetical protein
MGPDPAILEFRAVEAARAPASAESVNEIREAHRLTPEERVALAERVRNAPATEGPTSPPPDMILAGQYAGAGVPLSVRIWLATRSAPEKAAMDLYNRIGRQRLQASQAALENYGRNPNDPRYVAERQKLDADYVQKLWVLRLMQQGNINPQWGVPVVQTEFSNPALEEDLAPSFAWDLPFAPVTALLDPFEMRSGDQLYQGASGAFYKYDLGNLIDQIRFDVDPLAQLKDSINVDPRVEIDRGIGEYGGGVSP